MVAIAKRVKANNAKVDRARIYPVDDAFQLAIDTASAKFEEGVDVSIRLGIDAKKSDQNVRSAANLPHGAGKVVRVAVFTQGDNATAAQEAGADVVGMDELAADMKAGNLNYDVVIASPDAMRVVGQLGQVLGPRGLMPNPKVGTVTPNIADAVQKAKAGQVRYRNDKAGIIHARIGSAKFDPSQLKDNLIALITDLKKNKPASAKGTFIKKVTISTTMGPGIVIDLGTIE